LKVFWGVCCDELNFWALKCEIIDLKIIFVIFFYFRLNSENQKYQNHKILTKTLPSFKSTQTQNLLHFDLAPDPLAS